MKVRQLLGNWGILCGLALAGLSLAGCHRGGDPRFSDVPGLAPASPAAGTAPSASAGAPDSTSDVYKLKPNDALKITFADLPQFSVQPEFNDRIKEDGSITLMQNQNFVAAGKTRRELEREIRARYVPDIFKSMTVTVNYQNDTRFFYVGGEVKTPGRQVYIDHMTVVRAIQSAGDFTDFAKKTKVQLNRAASGQKIIINYPKALMDPKLDVEVYPSDSIVVPRRIL